jgi:hypothetical protein
MSGLDEFRIVLFAKLLASPIVYMVVDLICTSFEKEKDEEC